MALQIYLYFIGKPKNVAANAMAAEYLKMASRYLPCQSKEIQPNRFDPWKQHPNGLKVLLDPEGKAMDSPQFARWFQKAELDSRDLVFIVGGHDGLPAAWRIRGDLLFSLSVMTWPHELARVMLAEQIYRALATLRGHPYPR